jgi:hypothetical protein
LATAPSRRTAPTRCGTTSRPSSGASSIRSASTPSTWSATRWAAPSP